MAEVIKSIKATGGDYSTIAAWEADLDDGAVYNAGDDAIGELYAETYSEQASVTGGGTLGLTSVTLRANAAERHDGTVGSGPVITNVNNPFWGEGTSLTPVYNFEWFEYDFNNGDDSEIITLQQASTTNCRNLIVHNATHTSTSFNTYGMRTRGTSDVHTIENCLVFNVNASGGFRVTGIINENTTVATMRNNTVTDINATNGTSGDAQGINFNDIATTTLENNLVTDINSTAGVTECYDNATVTLSTCNTNGSDDATSPNSGLRNLTVAFENAAGSDYRLASGDTDAIDVGTDLGAVPAAVDLLGRNRDTEGDTWDLGGFEYVPTLTITDVDTDETWDDGDTGLVITGTGFV